MLLQWWLVVSLFFGLLLNDDEDDVELEMHQGVKGENGDRQDQLHPGLFRTFDSDFDKKHLRLQP